VLYYKESDFLKSFYKRLTAQETEIHLIILFVLHPRIVHMTGIYFEIDANLRLLNSFLTSA